MKVVSHIIPDSWKNHAINKNTNIDKNKNILTIIQENYPFGYMFFDYIPREDVKNWNDELENKHHDNQKIVEYLFTEYSKQKKLALLKLLLHRMHLSSRPS